MRLFKHFFGEYVFVRREEGVALLVAVNECEVESICEGERLCVDLCTTDDKYFFLANPVRLLERIFDRVRHLDAIVSPGCVSRDDYVGAPGEWLTKLSDNGLERLSPHDDGVAEGECLEALEVFGYMPQEPIILTDGAVLPECGDDADSRVHTDSMSRGWRVCKALSGMVR